MAHEPRTQRLGPESEPREVEIATCRSWGEARRVLAAAKREVAEIQSAYRKRGEWLVPRLGVTIYSQPYIRVENVLNG